MIATVAECDACLVRRLRAGDELAFELIHSRYRPQLLRHAERVLGSARSAAEDVVQDALVRAHRALMADDREIDLAPWLHTIIRNRAMDELRRHGARPVTSAVFEQPSLGPGPHALFVQRETLREVTLDVVALPPRQRHVLMGSVGGRAHAELATELGVTESATKALAQRARLSLRVAARARTATDTKRRGGKAPLTVSDGGARARCPTTAR